MGNLTLKKIGGICFSVLMIVGAVVGTIGFVLDWWGPVFNRDETIANPAFATQPKLRCNQLRKRQLQPQQLLVPRSPC